MSRDTKVSAKTTQIKFPLGRLVATPNAQEAYRLFRRHHVTHVYVGTIEQARWKHLEKFNDTAYFVTSYSDSAVGVYSLNELDADPLGKD